MLKQLPNLPASSVESLAIAEQFIPEITKAFQEQVVPKLAKKANSSTEQGINKYLQQGLMNSFLHSYLTPFVSDNLIKKFATQKKIKSQLERGLQSSSTQPKYIQLWDKYFEEIRESGKQQQFEEKMVEIIKGQIKGKHHKSKHFSDYSPNLRLQAVFNILRINSLSENSEISDLWQKCFGYSIRTRKSKHQKIKEKMEEKSRKCLSMQPELSIEHFSCEETTYSHKIANRNQQSPEEIFQKKIKVEEQQQQQIQYQQQQEQFCFSNNQFVINNKLEESSDFVEDNQSSTCAMLSVGSEQPSSSSFHNNNESSCQDYVSAFYGNNMQALNNYEQQIQELKLKLQNKLIAKQLQIQQQEFEKENLGNCQNELEIFMPKVDLSQFNFEFQQCQQEQQQKEQQQYQQQQEQQQQLFSEQESVQQEFSSCEWYQMDYDF